MRRSDFLRTFGRGAVISTGLAFGGRVRVLSKETPDAGTVLYATLEFNVLAYETMTESRLKEMWEEEMDTIKRRWWPEILKERNKLIGGRHG